MPETAYARCGDVSLAYQVFGDGPIELVFMGPVAGHVELFWTLPDFKSFFEQLAMFCRVVLFDKAGLGLSDPIPQVRTLDDRVSEIEATHGVEIRTAIHTGECELLDGDIGGLAVHIGIPGGWEVLTVDQHGAQSNSTEAKLSSMPTPHPRETGVARMAIRN